jgi:hypothetical protein
VFAAANWQAAMRQRANEFAGRHVTADRRQRTGRQRCFLETPFWMDL